MRTDPTEEDIYTPEFDAVWKAIKDWDIGKKPDDVHDYIYAGATGTDVMTILNAIRPVKKKGADLTLQFFKGSRPRFGHYFIGTTKVLMLGPIRVFVSKDL